MDEFVVNAAKSAASHIDIDGLIQAFEVLIQDEIPMNRLPPPGQRMAHRARCGLHIRLSAPARRLAGAGCGTDVLLAAGERGSAGKCRCDLPAGRLSGTPCRTTCGGERSSAMDWPARRRAACSSMANAAATWCWAKGWKTRTGKRHAMAGLLKLETSFARRKLHLGYRRAVAGQGFPLRTEPLRARVPLFERAARERASRSSPPVTRWARSLAAKAFAMAASWVPIFT